MTYVLDTNIIIHLISGNPTAISRYEECLLDSKNIALSPYVDFEIRRGLRYKKATAKEQVYEKLCQDWILGEMGRNVWLQAVNIYSELRHKGFSVCDADILIAALCLENHYTLVTNNTKDFININGLKLINWVT